MAALAQGTNTQPAVVGSVVRGGIAGLIGGAAFGVLMQVMDMMKMVGMLVGNEAAIVGWLVHLAISAFIGATFVLLFGRYLGSFPRGIVFGLGYGLFWWVLGALILMPLRLGSGVFGMNAVSMTSLLGHLVFGAVTGAVVVLLARRLAIT